MTELTDPQGTPLTIKYLGHDLLFYPVSDIDHIGQYLSKSKSFYELDVLEKISECILDRQGTAIDAGAFIGTHSIYFQKFCGCSRVLSFEANPDTFPFLLRNIRANNLDENIVPVETALGATQGFAHISFSREGNQGNTVLSFDKSNTTGIEVATIDAQVESRREMSPVKLIKIDVEGAEIEVLQGARNTIHTHRPLLCIEIHKTRHLLRVLMDIRGNDYLILDCLGSSPTYIFQATATNALRRYMSNAVWVAHSFIPPHLWNNLRWSFKRLAQIAGGTSGRRD